MRIMFIMLNHVCSQNVMDGPPDPVLFLFDPQTARGMTGRHLYPRVADSSPHDAAFHGFNSDP